MSLSPPPGAQTRPLKPQSATTAKAAIVFSCDDAYAFLARGLVLSLAAAGYPDGETKLILIDIGCSPATLRWMTDRGVDVVEFDANLIPQEIMSVIKPHQRAQVLRPWLPELLPHVEHFMHLDCDLWLQNGALIKLLRTGAGIAPESVMLAPGASHYNTILYTDMGRLMTMQRTWFDSFYPPEFVDQSSMMLNFSSGVFGLKRSSPVWDLWKQEAKFLYPLVAEREPRLLHLAEQTALNAVLFRTNQFVRLDPVYNFHCNAGGAMRLADGRVVTNMMLPIQEIGVVHLANWSFLRSQYLELQLLYRAGDYLFQERGPRSWADGRHHQAPTSAIAGRSNV